MAQETTSNMYEYTKGLLKVARRIKRYMRFAIRYLERGDKIQSYRLVLGMKHNASKILESFSLEFDELMERRRTIYEIYSCIADARANAEIWIDENGSEQQYKKWMVLGDLIQSAELLRVEQEKWGNRIS